MKTIIGLSESGKSKLKLFLARNDKSYYTTSFYFDFAVDSVVEQMAEKMPLGRQDYELPSYDSFSKKPELLSFEESDFIYQEEK